MFGLKLSIVWLIVQGYLNLIVYKI